MSERADPLQLGNDCAHQVVSFLGARDALSLSACSKAWRQLVLGHERQWQARAARDFPPPLLRAAAAAAAAGQSWAAAYERATRLQSLRCVAWSSEGRQPGRSVAGRQPRPREGHAACAWGTRSMLICGGFGGGILSGGDLHLLTPMKPSSSGSSDSGSGSPDSSTGSGLRWVQPRVSGHPPVHRYGHTLTRCGEQAVLFGGLQAGGYQAPLDTLAVLRRRVPASGAAAGRDAIDGDSDSGTGGSEQDTSLALRQGGWQGSADGGGVQQLLWAQMFDFFMGQDDGEEEEEEEQEEEDEEEELSGSDSSSAASSDESAGEEGGLDSDTGSEYGSAEDEESDNEWLPGHSGEAVGAAARPASVVAAMARRSSSPHFPAAAGAGTTAAAGAGTTAAAGGLHQPEAGPSRATDDAVAVAAGASAAGAAAWGGEDAGLADEELEWFFPRVSGEPPGARGYHSAAASEDGTKLYVFGGIAATGACNTLAVLDLRTWEWSRPLTHGTPPSPRCGHSSFVHGGRLWVVGGGSGRDLLRSGRDLADVHCLDLTTMEWRRLALPPGPLCTGKCHAAALVGRRLLLFGGSMASCNELAWLDVEREEWGAPLRVLGPPPCECMSATAVLCGEEVVVYGGYTFSYREVGDVHRLRLLPAEGGSAATEADARGERAAARRRQRWGPWW